MKRRAGAVVGTTAAIGSATLLVVRRWKRRRGIRANPSGPIVAGGAAGRPGQMARSAGRIGVSYGIHQAQRTFASAARRERLDEAFLLHSAEEVTETLGNLKGVMMKLGQMASYLDLGLPEEMRAVLATLQAAAPPMAPELATETLEKALGTSVSDSFSEWDPEAIAAASIGQVHRAITLDGRAVAVKVQYPGIAEAMAEDLEHTDVIFTALRMLFPALEVAPLVDELRTRLAEELDYVNEATNQQRFADAYRDHPFIVVPDVVEELSNERVLTSDLLAGRSFADMAAATQPERDVVAEAIFRYVMRSLYCMGSFNGDPHPGNYLVLDDGRVAFLDYGLVKHFTSDEIELFAAMHTTMVDDGDVAGFKVLLVDAGIVGAETSLGDERLYEYFSGFYEHLLRDEPTTITREFAAGLVSRMFDTDGPFADVQRQINVPPSFLLIQRINLGLYALFADLDASANWHAILADIVPWAGGSGTGGATDMGRAEADWLDQRAGDATPRM
ncbi:MAG TPA: AarF/ABC1/UbiB kinase family protein [Acidimicrobiales bacterium]|nr:AarF/ABC1/UbiB kinase family protein [Acidimicrobiales bacterium]